MRLAARSLAAAVVVAISLPVAVAGATRPRPVAAPDGLSSRPLVRQALRAAVAASGADPMSADAWHLSSDDAMGVRSAWSHTTGGDVTVAIVDTGIDMSHPDLAPNLWTNPGEIPGNGVDDDHDGVVDDVHGVDLVNGDGNPSDDNGHGTHVAGIVGARGGNGVGASGVAWRVRLMAVKVLDAQAAGNTDTVAEGILWAVAHGARIINLSLAGAGRSIPLENAILAAQQAGVLIVVAAGNDHDNLGLLPSYPASYGEPNVLGVAATRQDGLLSAISNFGAGVDLSAPGEMILSTARGGGYEWRTGTSMAAPMVAGAAALVLAQSPGADYAGIEGALLGHARHVALPVGAGALDAGAALGGPVPAAAPAPMSAPGGKKARPKTRTTAAARAKAVARAKARARAKAKAAAKTRARLRARAARARAARAGAPRSRAAR